MRTKILFLMMLVAAGLMTGCGKDSEETPTKPEDPIPPVTTTYEIGGLLRERLCKRNRDIY